VTGILSSSFFWLYAFGALALVAIGAFAMLVAMNLVRLLIAIEMLIKGVTLFLALAGLASGNRGLAQSAIVTLIVIEVVLMIVANGLVLGLFRQRGTISTQLLNEVKE